LRDADGAAGVAREGTAGDENAKGIRQGVEMKEYFMSVIYGTGILFIALIAFIAISPLMIFYWKKQREENSEKATEHKLRVQKRRAELQGV
jgi:hypothetical protein